MTTTGPETSATDRDAEQAIELAYQLFDAARTGDAATLGRYLDAGVPATLTNGAGDSLLMLAAYHGHAGIVADLAGRGVDVNAVNDKDQTPLAGVAFKGYTAVAEVLVGAGADPDQGQPTARQTADMFKRQEMLDLFSRA
ncbi:ankyrin repeat domain-containing protein [Arthrobacter sp. H20]|uniref:ankyrin repeat domain-containing protein n=1 Tax=Arthrobacter sp. H20 TaxID=1267981 RepID=UPI00047CB95C|nr:ankyrin repeat domain-containing protein [Arthrobacter sp. H20]